MFEDPLCNLIVELEYVLHFENLDYEYLIGWIPLNIGLNPKIQLNIDERFILGPGKSYSNKRLFNLAEKSEILL